MAEVCIPDAPVRPRFVDFAPGFGQRFMLTVDTEEEFDWGAPKGRSNHSTDSIAELRKFQQFCEGHGVVPLYLVDHPIAASQVAGEVLGEAARAGRCEIGLHLHPWVNPPFLEELSEFNSYAGNLAPDLEREKFLRLRERIEQTFGVAPISYRAGRYGTGPHTAAILQEAGFAVDSSVRPLFDYSASGAPNYWHHPLRPYWLDHPGGLMELPLTTVFWGPLRKQARWFYPLLWRAPRLRGALSKFGLLERIPLTPEGISSEEALRGIDIALDDGLPLLMFSFHSPSLAPGHTSYVRTPADLDAFYDWWRVIFAACARRNVKPTTIREIMAAAALA